MPRKTLYMAVVAALALGAAPTTRAGDTPTSAAGWTKSADLSLSLTQASYNSAWTGSETGSASWSFAGDLAAEKALSPKFLWRNTLKLSYGMTHTEKDDSGGRHWLSPTKSSDRIFFESLMRMTLGIAVDPYASFTFESQFYNPYDDPSDSFGNVKRYIDPKTLSEGAGVGRTVIKNDQSELLSRAGLSLRQHITQDVLQVEPENKEVNTATDGGLEWVTDYAQTARGGSLKYVTKLRVFKALFYSESDKVKGTEQEDYWKAVDVSWENTLSVSVAKYIQVSLFGEVLYDKEVDLRGRFREVLGLGLTYKLF
jgi:hypothetical protein